MGCISGIHGKGGGVHLLWTHTRHKYADAFTNLLVKGKQESYEASASCH